MNGGEGEGNRERGGNGERGLGLREGVGEVAVDGDDGDGRGVGPEEGCAEGGKGWVAGFAVSHGEKRNDSWCLICYSVENECCCAIRPRRLHNMKISDVKEKMSVCIW